MRESSTYQMILDEGRIETLHQQILRQGPRKLGEPDKCVQDSLRSITNFGQLLDLSVALFDVSSWQELLERARA